MALERHGHAGLHERGRARVAQAADDAVVLERDDGLLAGSLAQEQVDVERLHAEHVDDLGGDALLVQGLRSLHRVLQQLSLRDDEHVGTLLDDVALAELERRALRVHLERSLAA